VQQARNLALTLCERFEAIRFLIYDRGSNFTASFDAVFEATGARILRSAVPAPRMNAICERLGGTLRRELLDRVLILGEAHVRAGLTDYQAHYNAARPHQGIAQRVPADERDAHPATVTDVDTRQIRRKPVLNGLINASLRSRPRVSATLTVCRSSSPVNTAIPESTVWPSAAWNVTA